MAKTKTQEGGALDLNARAVPGRVDQPRFFPGPYDLEAGFLITREPVGIGRPLLHLLPPAGSDTEAGFIVGERAEHEATANLLKASWDLYAAAKRALNVLKAQGESVRPGSVVGALDAALRKARGEA